MFNFLDIKNLVFLMLKLFIPINYMVNNTGEQEIKLKNASDVETKFNFVFLLI